MYKYFEYCKTLEDVKAKYKELMKKYHPDLNPPEKSKEFTEITQEINNEFEKAYAEFKNIHRNFNDEIYEHEYEEMDFKDFQDLIWKLLAMEDDCIIELIGCYIWVSNKVEGGTKKHKQELKEMGFKWHGKRNMWYLTRTDRKRKWSSNVDMDTIREKYGSSVINSNNFKAEIVNF